MPSRYENIRIRENSEPIYREIFEENFELARLRAEELGVNIQLLKGF